MTAHFPYLISSLLHEIILLIQKSISFILKIVEFFSVWEQFFYNLSPKEKNRVRIVGAFNRSWKKI